VHTRQDKNGKSNRPAQVRLRALGILVITDGSPLSGHPVVPKNGLPDAPSLYGECAAEVTSDSDALGAARARAHVAVSETTSPVERAGGQGRVRSWQQSVSAVRLTETAGVDQENRLGTPDKTKTGRAIGQRRSDYGHSGFW
jgi:hypothetical protein